MKGILFTLLLVVFGIFCASAQKAIDSSRLPRFQFIGGDSHDIGAVPEGPPAEHTYEFKNVGKSRLFVTEIQTSCGCLTPEWGTRDASGRQQLMIVAPGKKGRFKVTYSTQGRVGLFDKAVWITSNAIPSPGQPRYQVNIRGTVTPPSEITGR